MIRLLMNYIDKQIDHIKPRQYSLYIPNQYHEHIC